MGKKSVAEEEYDLKRVKKQLYPVLIDKRSGKIIDGAHRLLANSDWRTESVETKDEGEYLVLRLQANLYRRNVSEEEVRKWMNSLAEFFMFQKAIKAGKIVSTIAKETGYSVQRIRYYLDSKYKLKTSPIKKTLVASVSGKRSRKKSQLMQANLTVSHPISFTCPVCGEEVHISCNGKGKGKHSFR